MLYALTPSITHPTANYSWQSPYYQPQTTLVPFTQQQGQFPIILIPVQSTTFQQSQTYQPSYPEAPTAPQSMPRQFYNTQQVQQLFHPGATTQYQRYEARQLPHHTHQQATKPSHNAARVKQELCNLMLNKHTCLDDEVILDFIHDNQDLLQDDRIRDRQTLAALCIHTNRPTLLCRFIQSYPHIINLNSLIAKHGNGQGVQLITDIFNHAAQNQEWIAVLQTLYTYRSDLFTAQDINFARQINIPLTQEDAQLLQQQLSAPIIAPQIVHEQTAPPTAPQPIDPETVTNQIATHSHTHNPYSF